MPPSKTAAAATIASSTSCPVSDSPVMTWKTWAASFFGLSYVYGIFTCLLPGLLGTWFLWLDESQRRKVAWIYAVPAWLESKATKAASEATALLVALDSASLVSTIERLNGEMEMVKEELEVMEGERHREREEKERERGEKEGEREVKGLALRELAMLVSETRERYDEFLNLIERQEEALRQLEED